MKLTEKNGLRLLRFEKIPSAWPLIHAVSTRKGGVSPAPFDSLNIGPGTGDSADNVRRNRELVCRTLGTKPQKLAAMRQVHSDRVFIVRASGPGLSYKPEADALITAERGITLLAQSADCALTLFFDPVNVVLAVSHSGWRGAMLNIYSNVIKTMRKEYVSKPGNIFAGISPAISMENYEVGRDLISELGRRYPEKTSKSFYSTNDGKYRFSLKSLLEYQLAELGIKNIETAGMCTFADKDLFYSYRRDGKQTGRFGLFACINGSV